MDDIPRIFSGYLVEGLASWAQAHFVEFNRTLTFLLVISRTGHPTQLAQNLVSTFIERRYNFIIDIIS